MRITSKQMQTIRDVVSRECGSAARVRLFGSRLDDARRGGDVDLLIELDNPVDRPALLSARLSALISRSLGGRRVDVLLSAPNLTRQAVHRVAEQQGQLL